MTEVILFLVAAAVLAFAAQKAHRLYHSQPRRFLYGGVPFFMVADPDRGFLDDIYDSMSYLHEDGTPVTDEAHIRELRDYQKEEARRGSRFNG